MGLRDWLAKHGAGEPPPPTQAGLDAIVGAADRVVVIEDVVTTGGSTRETIAVAQEAGATVVGAGAIIDRSGGNSTLDVPFSALVTLSLPTYQPDACPMCKAGEPVVKPGSRT